LKALGEHTSNGPLRILVVEDELLIALDLAGMLEDLGHHPLGPAPTIDRALALLEAETPDAALLDENLNGRIVTPVAIRLARKKVPFTIISGHVRSVSDEPLLSDAPRLQKPVTKHQLATAFADM
jgi:two-component SAPR family response regulator